MALSTSGGQSHRQGGGGARQLRTRDVLVGIEGLAILHQLQDGKDADVEARIAEVRRLVDPDRQDGLGELDQVEQVEMDARELYRVWAATYDGASRPTRAVEEPVVEALLQTLPAGRALDAGCGTGRHAHRLVQLGHQVIGVDLSPEMVERARELVPGAIFEVGDLSDLPVETASVDLAVCGMALDHCPDLVPPLAELARTVRAGGRVVISDIHPVVSLSGGVAHATLPDGRRGFVRNHAHLHGEYLDAFAEVGLEPDRCLEPRYGDRDVALKRTAMAAVPEATRAAYVGLPAVMVWDLVRR